jgi:glycosyltransferase involved in cell wall biosynthesis
MPAMSERHFLHIFPTFATGGSQVRTVKIVNHLGSRFRHTFIALDGDFSAAARIDRGIDIDCYACPRTTNPIAMAARLRGVMSRLRPDLVLTYAWGAIDGVTAALVPPRFPVIHTEDGFGIEESEKQIPRRVLFRRYILRGAYRVIAPSRTLINIMLATWKLRPESTVYIPNGVDVNRFAPLLESRTTRGQVPRCALGADKRADNVVTIGAIAQLRPEKRIDLLLDAFAAAARGRNVRLRIAGDGPDRIELERKAATLGIADRAEFLGHVEDVAAVYRSLDIVALTSSTEQMPLCVLEGMAAGLPVVSTDVGDVRNMVSTANGPFLVNDAGVVDALGRLADDADLRAQIGQANRERCCAEYGINAMFAAWERLYLAAITRGDAKSAERLVRLADREVQRR